MNRRFRLESLLKLREAAEEHQKRGVQIANQALIASRAAQRFAKQWIDEATSSVVAPLSTTTPAELEFANACLSSRKEALRCHSVDHSRLVETFEREVSSLKAAHQQTAMIETLRAYHLDELRVHDRRTEQLSLDESFRLASGSRSGILQMVNSSD